MDNDTNELLRDIATLQKEQNELLKRYLWRLRFSLLTLLLITTATAVMLWIFETQRKSFVLTPASPPIFSAPKNSIAPFADPNATGPQNRQAVPIPPSPFQLQSNE